MSTSAFAGDVAGTIALTRDEQIAVSGGVILIGAAVVLGLAVTAAIAGFNVGYNMAKDYLATHEQPANACYM